MNPKKIYLGLDIGTDSVGWAVTDENYHLIKKQGKHLWGARLFSEASDASGRRAAREARRRLERRRGRILLLQDFFKEEMDKVDSNFFDRLNNSALHKEDKPENLRTPYLLFNEDGYTDKDFFDAKHYPTIYHLRKAMMDHPEVKFSIKEIYLVMAHMIKYRGNFLMDGEISADGLGKDSADIVDRFEELDNILRDMVEEGENFVSFGCDDKKAKALIELFEKEKRTKYLFDSFTDILKNPELSGLQKSLIRAICGSKVALSNFYPRLKEEDEEFGKTSIEFDSDAFEDVLSKLSEGLNQSEIDAIAKAYEIYNFRVLVNLLKGKGSLSDAMVEVYNTHRIQLKKLKKLIKEYNHKEFNHFFVKIMESKKGKKDKEEKELRKNYVNYIGMTSIHGHRVRVAHTCNQDDLYKTVKAILPFDKLDDASFVWAEPSDKEDMKKILDEMEAKTYLPRQNSKENGVFPYQLNKNEMKKIIDNQKQYYPFLGEMAPDYMTPSKESYKLISLLEYKIPYFVGPLSNKMGGTENFWMERKQEGKITPWNFHEMIDKEKTAQGFINRMKNYCTYLIGEETLPKNSLLYSEFMILNEINNWQIDDHQITLEDKEYLFDNLYKIKAKTPSLKDVASCLKAKYKDDVVLTTKTGKELKTEDIHANYRPYFDMADDKGFGPDFDKDGKLVEKAEKVIFIITMFEDKELKRKQLSELGLSEVQLKYFMTLKYKDWGKLSKKVLDGITTELVNQETGECLNYTVIDLMRTEPLCLMELLETKDPNIHFRDEIMKLNEEAQVTEETLIDASYASPAMKRAVRQTLKIIDELKHILQIDHFDAFFVECTRNEGEKGKRTKSRKKQLEDIYKAIDLKELVGGDDLKKCLESKSEGDLRKKKLFLYFMQLGRSVYTGDTIDLSHLDQDYDIDHIIPQAKLKDDSFNNTVLVEKTVNNTKQDSYPIPLNVLTEKGRKWVETLYQHNKKDFQLMPKDKMEKILRNVNKPLRDDELVGFVNRQLTMTDQSVKAVCEILREVEKGSKIVFSKANNVSEFRRVFDLVKCREINDFHHAHDAYLNIVVGNVYDKVFTDHFSVKLFRDHYQDYRSWKIDVENLFKRDQFSWNSINCGSQVWKAKRYIDEGKQIEDSKSHGTIDLVRKALSWNDPMVTQMLRTQNGDSGFFRHISFHSAKDGDAQFPLKQKAPFNSEGWKKKYGGYSDLTAPYFMLVESDGKKNAKQYSIENIPSIYLVSMKTEEEKIQFMIDNYKLKNPKIILDKLLIRTVIEFPQEHGKVRVGISGKGDNRIGLVNLSEPYYPKEIDLRYLKAISKILDLNATASKKVDISYLQKLDSLVCGKMILNAENNISVFNMIVDKVLNRDQFKYLPALGEKIQGVISSKTKFYSLSFSEQIVVISEVMKLVTCKKVMVNLTKLGLGEAKNLRIGKDLTKIPFRIIKQSPTGFYEKVLFEHDC